jgi:hypothetical protein
MSDWKARQVQQAKDEIEKLLSEERELQNRMREAQSQYEAFVQQGQQQMSNSVATRIKLEGRIEGLSAVEEPLETVE